MIIERLSSGSESLTVVSEWMWSEWGQPNNKRYWQYWVSRSTKENDIPQTFVAKEGVNIVGTVSLWRCDLLSCQDISPWLGGLYVDKAHRGKGYAKELVEYATNQASKLKYEVLYLFTELEGFFEKLGWEYMEDVPNEIDEMVKLYKKELVTHAH